jgi:iron complex outermembrane receptor protein
MSIRIAQSAFRPCLFSPGTILRMGACGLALTAPLTSLRAAELTGVGGLEEITVTASKKAMAESVQDVPFAVTAYGAAQLENQHVRSLQDISYNAPNVQLEDVGTSPGYANFSIRGLGVNSSIPSIDPTVGVFVDGIYLGISAGVLFDTFDLEGIEVLRGPQGLLFGRNVTGGAVVVRTTTPEDELRADAKLSLETGPNKTASFMLTGPIAETLSAKMAVFYNDDDGWYKNRFNGNDDLGQSETLIIRPALKFTPTDSLEFVLRYEHGRLRGDGAVASNHGLFAKDSFDVAIDEEGFTRNDWDQAILETNVDVPFGDGVITNVAGWRKFDSFTFGDIDASPSSAFHAHTRIRQDQFSDELRYAGTFGPVEVTTGLYYFTQDINYMERRRLANGALIIGGGGDQDQQTTGAFVSGDWHITDTWTLNSGIRYSRETKDVKVANLTPGGCDIFAETCNYLFVNDKTWSDVTPKVGFQWQPDDTTQIYGFWARGFRSGGYNFRNANPLVRPGPFDAEQQNSFEIGLKQDIAGAVRVNAAVFFNQIDDLQREIITPVAGVGTVQIITNSADAEVKGAELEVQVDLGNLTLGAQGGYTDGEYTTIRYDLNNNGAIDSVDYSLQLPRLAPWTYGFSVSYTRDIGSLGSASASASINHRDAAWYNDANTGLLTAADMLQANVSFTTLDERWKLSVYGNNLLDEATFGTEAPLPFFPRATFSSLNKGRVLGAEVTFKF